MAICSCKICHKGGERRKRCLLNIFLLHLCQGWVSGIRYRTAVVLVCYLMKRPLVLIQPPPLSASASRPASFVSQTQALSHPDEVWGVSPSPTDPSLLVTCSNGARAGQADGGAGFKVPFEFCASTFRR